MKLTAYPFDAVTGELLSVYRDAYLRGDLSQENTRLVDTHLKNNSALGTQTWQRFHAMEQTGEQVQAVGWMQRQMDLVRTSPQRVRRQVASLVAITALIGGGVFASTNRPIVPAEADEIPSAATTVVSMTTVHGRILDENGRPLVGATVLDKASYRGVSTNAEGEYTLTVPAGRPAVLAYGYGGYTGDEIRVTGQKAADVTLVPSDEASAKKVRKFRHWFAFN